MVIPALEITSSEGDDKKPVFSFSVYGEAIWAPLVYKGGNTDVDETDGKEPGFGVGAGGWGSPGAAISFGVTVASPNNSIGAELHFRPEVGDGTFRVLDNKANIWFQPFEMFKGIFGLYKVDDFRGQIKASDIPIGAYGGNENDIFHSLVSDYFGALFFLTPPSTAPDALKGFKLFGSFGVSGWLDQNSPAAYAARTGKSIEYIFTTPQAGLIYQNNAFGMVRFQYIGSNYKWGQGTDWSTFQSPGNYNVVKHTHALFPTYAREAAQFEFAVNITAIPYINLDVGCNIPFPVTVIARDNSATNRGMPVGPTYLDLGSRARTSWADTNYLADTVDDKWAPPNKIALALDFYLEDVGFGALFRSKIEFGEQVAFANGFPNFKGGIKFEAGLEPRYAIGDFGIFSLNLSMRFKQNSTFGGKNIDFDIYDTLNTYSIKHNGTVDLGLGAFFTRPLFGKDNYIKIGLAVNLPVGGDRYDWSDNTVTGTGAERLGKEFAEAYKMTNFIIMVPIIAQISF